MTDSYWGSENEQFCSEANWNKESYLNVLVQLFFYNFSDVFIPSKANIFEIEMQITQTFGKFKALWVKNCKEISNRRGAYSE